VTDARLTGWQAVNYALALLPISLAPAVLGMAGRTYFIVALVLGVVFLGASVQFLVQETRATARRLLLASLVYLPFLFGCLWADRVPGA
jgi:protoheme IX farnesyltransferase